MAVRRPTRLWLASIPLALSFATLSAVAAAAQGTPQQRAACEDEARWLCSNYIPDVDAITACMVRNRHLLSPRCRATLGGGKSTPKRRPRRDD